MPTCVGQVRRIILDQFGNRYGRRFDTHWDFVRYAQEQNLDLDFTTPPQRPDPKLPALFEPDDTRGSPVHQSSPVHQRTRIRVTTTP